MTPEEEKTNEAIRASVRGGKGCMWAMAIVVALVLVTCLGWVWAQTYQTWVG